MIGTDIPEHLAGAVLSIDLDAICANYQILLKTLNGVPSAAVIKADGYGLGAEQVGKALAAAGCTIFFIAHVSEGVRLRAALPNVEIHILNGLAASALDAYKEHRLVPVLGSLGEIATWKYFCADVALPCDIHVDTGMLRLGLPPAELTQIADDPARLQGLDVRFVMSHLASADEAGSPQNGQQLAAFRKARAILPMGIASFANSSGIFLGADYHFDMARPGVALFGVNPTPEKPNPMRDVITLNARIQQLRDAGPGDSVGYGAAYSVEKPSVIATLAVGYADGYLRSLSNAACAIIDGISVPLVGRVSMDLITLDVTNVAEEKRQPGQWAQLIGPGNPVDDIAARAGTMGYEILTNLGRRYHRVYTGAPT